MAYDLEEQEKLDAIKHWWAQYGNLVTTVILAVLVGIAGTQGWRYYRAQQTSGAATLYAQLETAEASNEPKKVQEIALAIADKYKSTVYASMAALRAAKTYVTANDVSSAKTRIQWVIDNTKDDEMRDVAQLRLAGLLLDEKKYDEALKLLEAKHSTDFDGLYADLKGDILVEQGKRAEARASYQIALDRSDARGNYRQMIQLKLDALGEAK